MSFGVYVHVPFCARRCDYCAFATWTGRDHLMDRYAQACITSALTLDRPASSVFFGGGTPSRLPAHLLVGILDAIPRADDCEVTVECNPETVTPSLLAAYRAAGVNRLSFGVQSMVPHVLRGLGRVHEPASVINGVGWAVAEGFPTWNVDLIYGGSGERDVDWDESLSAVLALDPPHVSAYALTVEPGTPLASDPARHPDDDVSASRYLTACDRLARAGLENYEISNFARPGHECRHNLLYWQQGDYRGIGCAAHSHEAGRRWWNVRTPERFISLVEDGAPPVAGEEVLSPSARSTERLELALRTREGVPASTLSDIETLLGAGLVGVTDGQVVLTPSGRLLADEVTLRLRP